MAVFQKNKKCHWRFFISLCNMSEKVKIVTSNFLFPYYYTLTHKPILLYITHSFTILKIKNVQGGSFIFSVRKWRSLDAVVKEDEQRHVKLKLEKSKELWTLTMIWHVFVLLPLLFMSLWFSWGSHKLASAKALLT